MYRAFNLSSINNLDNYVQHGKNLMEKQRVGIRKSIDEYLSINGTIDGKKLEKNWFPQISSDIFISHSHTDENLALGLSGWLEYHLKINAFVDSNVWGYAGELLYSIDKRYCFNDKTNNYRYEDRNISTAHVHVMLCAALTKMMDETECLFFISTPSSITTKSALEDSETNSPWIYLELTLADLIQKPLSSHSSRKDLIKSERATEMFSVTESMNMKVSYPVNLDNMKKLSRADLDKWKNSYDIEISKPNPMDKLYSLFGSAKTGFGI